MPLTGHDKAQGIRNQWYVDGSNNHQHTVTEWGSGFWSCACTGWILHCNKLIDHRRGAPQKNHCKHIREVFAGGGRNVKDAAPTIITTNTIRSIQPKGRAIARGDEEV